MNKLMLPGLAIAIFAAFAAGATIAQSPTPSSQELMRRLDTMERKYQRIADQEEVEKVQLKYGYYVERGDLDEAAALFSTASNVTLEMSGRVRVGPAEVRKTFSSATPFGVMTPGAKPKDYLHITAPISGIVDVADDGKTAKGRWYALMFLNNAGMGGGAVWGIGIYENEYVKENGAWKISRLVFDDIILSAYDKKGWINTMPAYANGADNRSGRGRSRATPFADLMPYHYQSSITGK